MKLISCIKNVRNVTEKKSQTQVLASISQEFINPSQQSDPRGWLVRHSNQYSKKYFQSGKIVQFWLIGAFFFFILCSFFTVLAISLAILDHFQQFQALR